MPTSPVPVDPAAFPDFTVRSFQTPNLLQIGMPMGGIGAGCICLNGHGGLQDFSLYHKPATTALADGHLARPGCFATLRVRGASAGLDTARLLEGPLPPEKLYDQGLQAQGFRQGGYEGLPRFESCEFHGAYPFGRVELADSALPLRAAVTGWSPLIPLDDKNSGLPCALLEYRFENTGDAPLELEFAYHMAHLARGRDEKHTRNRVLGDSGVLFYNTEAADDETFGSAALVVAGHRPLVKAMWLRGGWFDWISALWREISVGPFAANTGNTERDVPGYNGGSVMVARTLAPGETLTVPVILAWHFPNSNLTHGQPAGSACCGDDDECGGGPAWRPYYAGQFPDAGAAAAHAAEHYESLKARTLAFARALADSTLPPEVLDAVSANLSILKSPTVLRQENGNVWAWEGCCTTEGCCAGSCTHVWNYAQSLPHLFPALERTLREQELERSMDEMGHVNFRAALPDGPTAHEFHPASDGQLGGILKLFRDWQVSGDTAWMRGLYPLARRSLDFCIARWDPERRGGLFEPHHNTYDIEFWGPDGMCGSIYLAALWAMARLADALGFAEDAARDRELARRGAAFADAELFNGEYYQQQVRWQDARDRSFADRLASPEITSEELALLSVEGPKYQYGDGCLSDGVIGAWMAAEYGSEPPFNREHVRSTLSAIFRHNFKADLFSHACTQRPGYALGHEPGLLLCTWPRGNKPTLPFVYSDEVWTGIEYQVASHLIHEGMTEEGLAIARGVRQRYEGHVRNPFNEYECGSYYARAMASYALLTALSGFRYSAVDRTLWLAPKLETSPFRCFFSTASGWGTVTLTGEKLTVEIVEGTLRVEHICLQLPGKPMMNRSAGGTAEPGHPLEIAL